MLCRQWDDQVWQQKKKKKKQKRQKQKFHRKLKFTANSGAIDSSEIEHSSYVVGRILPDEIGEDTNVMHMELEDFYKEWDGSEHSNTYLKECRQKLLEKVKEYRQKVEQLHTEKIETAHKHRTEIEIHTFYMNIAYGMSHSGRILKKAMSTSDAAKEVLKMLGYEELQKQLLAMDSSDNYF